MIFEDVVLDATFYRKYSPITLSKIVKELPLNTRAMKKENVIILFTNIVAGRERPSRKFAKGEVFYSPMDGTIVIALDDLQYDTEGNLLGNVKDISPILTKDRLTFARLELSEEEYEESPFMEDDEDLDLDF